MCRLAWETLSSHYVEMVCASWFYLIFFFFLLLFWPMQWKQNKMFNKSKQWKKWSRLNCWCASAYYNTRSTTSKMYWPWLLQNILCALVLNNAKCVGSFMMGWNINVAVILRTKVHSFCMHIGGFVNIKKMSHNIENMFTHFDFDCSQNEKALTLQTIGPFFKMNIHILYENDKTISFRFDVHYYLHTFAFSN